MEYAVTALSINQDIDSGLDCGNRHWQTRSNKLLDTKTCKRKKEPNLRS